MAFLAALLLVPLVGVLCSRFQLYDLPGPLKIHTQPIPRLGGVAIVLALVLGVAAARIPMSRSAWFPLAALTLVWASGLIDDVRGLHPAIRLTTQMIAATLLWSAGWRLFVFDNAILDAGATCLFVVLFINSFNFLDGADGVAAGVTALIAIGYIALPSGARNEPMDAIAWGLLGACGAFLLSNFPPAKIFLGDSGSSTLGFIAGFLGLSLPRPAGSGKSPLLFALLVAALPLLDVLLAVARRIRQRGSPFQGDRRHIYDLFLARGWTVRGVALICYGLTVGLVSAGWIIVRAGPSQALVTSGMIVVGLLALAVRMGSLRPQDRVGKEFAGAGLQWRELFARRLRQKT
ncbi:MAG: MraY family glycosyltransferase [Candidatus Acidiferrales bacterium]